MASKDLEELKKQIGELAGSELPEKPKLSDTPTYERDNYVAPTDDEISKSASDEYAEYRRNGLKGIDAQTETKRSSLEESKTAAGKRMEETEKKLSGGYEKAKEDVGNDALKRGVARSSIAVGEMGKLAEGHAAALSAAQTEYAEYLKASDEKLAALQEERQAAINDFNLTLAAKVTSRINELKAERAERELAAKKYNNSLAEKEYSNKTDKQMKESDLYSEALTQKKKENELSENAQSGLRKQAYEIADDAFSRMSQADREAAYKDVYLRTALGDYYTFKLYDKYLRK